MTLAELADLLRSTGYPVAYSHFSGDNIPPPPFITYREDSSANFFADGCTYKKIRLVVVELYTDKKDLDAEAALEAAFDMNGIPYEATETWIDTEGLFQRIYEIGVV